MADVFRIQSIEAVLATQEKKKILEILISALPDAVVAEVGSSAVQGVIGKGDIDILVKVNRGLFEEARIILDRLLKRNPAQLSNEQYQGYLVNSPIDVSVQLTVIDSIYDTFDVFLNALKNNRDLVARYNELKRQWDGKPMVEYRQAKSAFIEAVISNA